MCGFSGAINIDSGFSKSHFFEVSKSVHQYRGPDHFNVFEKEGLLLTHSRLKIIDLSDDANQPMSSHSGKSILVFNGEIYNYKSISKDLKKPLKTTSDTEVVIEAIETWGIEKTLKKLNGMFAFCYVNFEKGIALLARDRFGKKPLYYAQVNGRLLFASDIRVITEVEKPNLTLNFDSIDYYLSELSMPQPYTIWREVKQVRPAHYIQVNLNDYSLEDHQYWALTAKKNEAKSEEDTLIELETRLNQSIQSRLVSDVPIGCFLSGGVDSGLIVSLLAQQTTSPIKTFTVGFDYDDFNELEDAKRIADRYQTEHHTLKIAVDIQNDIEHILQSFGEPFADSSAIPTYYISKEIRKHVTVALSGDGGDELFGGYLDYGHANQAEQFKNKYPSKWAQQSVGLASKIGSRLSSTISNKGTALEYLNIRSPFQLYRNMGFAPEASAYFVKNRDFSKSYFDTIWQAHNQFPLTEQLMRASMHTRLVNDYLVKVDRASMAHSVEVRSPLLDYQLAEFAFSIPNTLKFRHNHSKYLLKQLGKKHMYADIFTKPKRGFGVPIKHWLKHELFDFAHTHISALINRGQFVNKNAIDLLLEHKKGNFDHTHRIWALVCLEIWLKQHFD